MTGLEVVLGVAGVLVTLMVVIGMVLLTPRNVEQGARATTDVDRDPHEHEHEHAVSRAGSGPTGRRPRAPRR